MFIQQSMILVAMSVMMVSGKIVLFDDSPCFIRPEYAEPGIPQDANNIVNITVPEKCRNGTISWHYPRGHLVITFPIIKKLSKSICFTDHPAPTYFTITVSPGNIIKGLSDHGNRYCTDVITNKETTIKISSSDRNVYFGQLLYSFK